MTAIADGQLTAHLLQPLRASGLRGTLPVRKQQYVRVPLKQSSHCGHIKQQQNQPLEKGASELNRLEHKEFLGCRKELLVLFCQLDFDCLRLQRLADTRGLGHLLEKKRARQLRVGTRLVHLGAKGCSSDSTTHAPVPELVLAAVNGTRARSVTPDANAKRISFQREWRQPFPAVVAEVGRSADRYDGAADTARPARLEQ